MHNMIVIFEQSMVNFYKTNQLDDEVRKKKQTTKLNIVPGH